MAPIELTMERILSLNPGVVSCILEIENGIPENFLRAMSMADRIGEAYEEDEDELDMKSRIFFELALGYQGEILRKIKLSSGITYFDRITEIIADENAKINLYLAIRRRAWQTEA